MGAEEKIWLCEVAAGEVRRLECGRRREEMVDELIAQAERDPRFVVGLDFAFSLPVTFTAKRHRTIDGIWGRVEREGEEWLAECPFPFWGKPRRKRPGLALETFFRRTDLDTGAAAGRRPLSVFQIGGAGAVGVGSLRGMPFLSRLRKRGFAIWPFDPPGEPLVVEIWPRVFMGGVVKSRAEVRRAFLGDRYPDLAPSHLESAAASGDAFDALVSALEMDRHRAELEALDPVDDPVSAVEGGIWRPASVSR